MEQRNNWTGEFNPSTFSESTILSTGFNPGQTPVQSQPHNTVQGAGVSKTARKRTRASRRAPTTLLNTNPSNFRAMVQQFTGAPTGPSQYPNPTQSAINFAQYGQYSRERYDEAVTVAGEANDLGFVQGYNAGSSGTYFNEANNTNGGYFL